MNLTRKQARIFADNQLQRLSPVYTDGKKPEGHAHYYGRQDIEELLDVIYGINSKGNKVFCEGEQPKEPTEKYDVELYGCDDAAYHLDLTESQAKVVFDLAKYCEFEAGCSLERAVKIRSLADENYVEK